VLRSDHEGSPEQHPETGGQEIAITDVAALDCRALIRALGGANHVTLVDVSASLHSLEQKAAHFRQTGLEESSKLVAGDIRVLQAMVPGPVAGHSSIPSWERDKAYQIGDLITAENGVWRLSNGTGGARNDWTHIWARRFKRQRDRKRLMRRSPIAPSARPFGSWRKPLQIVG